MNLRDQRLSILRRVQEGILTAAEGNILLGGLEGAPWEETPVLPEGLPGEEQPVEADLAAIEKTAPEADARGEEIPRGGGWRGLWIVPFVLGLLLTVFSINWMYLGYASAGPGWGFWLSFIPLALAILMMWLGWELRQARWLNVRIRHKPGHSPTTIAFSVPLPVGLTRWALQRFGRFTPFGQGRELDEFMAEFDQATASEGPMHVFVDDRDGEQVEIWISGPKDQA